jgi:hypothetical protein
MARLVYDRGVPKASYPDRRKWSSPVEVGASASNSGTWIADGTGGWKFTPLANIATWQWTRQAPVLDNEVIYRSAARQNYSSGTFRTSITIGTTSGDVDSSSSTKEVPKTGIRLSLSEAGSLSLTQYVNGTATTLATAVTGKTGANTAYDWRFLRRAGRIQARVWKTADPEPSAWDFDVADDGTVPAGVVGICVYRAGTASSWTFGSISSNSARVESRPHPKIAFTADNRRRRYGKVRSTIVDDAISATQNASLTGDTTTRDATLMTRSITAAANASAALAFPAVALSTVDPMPIEAIELTARGLFLSSDTAATPRLQFVGGSKTWELFHLSGSNATLTDGTTTALLNLALRGNGEATRHRNLSLLLVPRYKQLIALMDDMVIGWIETSGITGNVTPTLKVDSTTTTAKSLSYAQLELALERS